MRRSRQHQRIGKRRAGKRTSKRIGGASMAGNSLKIIHPTDFSLASMHAFLHALKMACLARGELLLLHLDERRDELPHWSDFPRVRETLANWGLLEQSAPREAVEEQLGVRVAKFDLVEPDIVAGVDRFAERHGADVLVLGSEGRQGLARLLAGSKAEAIARRSNLSTLFVPAQARGFVDPHTGESLLRKILAPVDHEPDPLHAIHELVRFMGPFGLHSDMLTLLHVGEDAPLIRVNAQSEAAPVVCVDGPVVEAIIDAAADADLIVLATRGHDGFLDALRGSTTEQIVRRAPCPVLAVPAR